MDTLDKTIEPFTLQSPEKRKQEILFSHFCVTGYLFLVMGNSGTLAACYL